MAGADFKRQFAQKGNEYTLGSDIVLAYKITYRIKGENLHLSLQPKSGEGIKMVINQGVNAAVSRMLGTAVGQAGWALEMGVVASERTPRIIN